MRGQMCANACLLGAVNVLGIFTRFSNERSRRLGFHETRNCMHARLLIQRENQQQVPACVLLNFCRL